MPSKDHVDGDHPPQHDAFHQKLCIADLFKALAERTSRVSPSAIENRMLIEISATALLRSQSHHRSSKAVMPASSCVHQHVVRETFLDKREAAIGTIGAAVARLGSPPQRGRPQLIEPQTPL